PRHQLARRGQQRADDLPQRRQPDVLHHRTGERRSHWGPGRLRLWIWLEGINDLGALHTTDSIKAGYQNVVSRLHAAGVKVYAGTLTSALGIYGVPFPTGDNGTVAEAGRQVLNDYIRNSGIFAGVEEFDLARH